MSFKRYRILTLESLDFDGKTAFFLRLKSADSEVKRSADFKVEGTADFFSEF